MRVLLIMCTCEAWQLTSCGRYELTSPQMLGPVWRVSVWIVRLLMLGHAVGGGNCAVQGPPGTPNSSARRLGKATLAALSTSLNM